MILCNICGKKFDFIWKLDRHLSGKRPCAKPLPLRTSENLLNLKSQNNTVLTQTIENPTQKSNNELNSELNISSISINSENISNNSKCEYCNKCITRKNMVRHVINSCRSVPIDIRDNYVRIHNNHSKTKNKIIKYNGNNIGNYIDNSTTNNLNNNNLINISNFDEDDYSHLTFEDMKKICSSGYDMYSVLGDYLCRNEKNINFAIPNKKEDMVHVIKNNRLDVVSLRDFKEAKMDRTTVVLEYIYNNMINSKVLSDIEIRTLKDLLDIDKFKQHFKYEQYLNEVYRQLLKFNDHFRKTFKTRKYKNAIFNSVITDLKHKLNPKINLN